MDPIEFTATFDDDSQKIDATKIHIYVQQRKANKYITTVQGIDPQIDIKKLLKAFKKTFNCNGAIVTDNNDKTIIQLAGDQRRLCADFIKEQGIANSKDDVIVHGA